MNAPLHFRTDTCAVCCRCFNCKNFYGTASYLCLLPIQTRVLFVSKHTCAVEMRDALLTFFGTGASPPYHFEFFSERADWTSSMYQLGWCSRTPESRPRRLHLKGVSALKIPRLDDIAMFAEDDTNLGNRPLRDREMLASLQHSMTLKPLVNDFPACLVINSG